ncbi:MAG: UDP-N-acetylmuramoyl-tripeptide--D-alanyl-D-alanine ligase [Flavobacteriaceae bacterium]|jgi:UDP-N-acetylmuramoyl-tripeptide--D-alanyl-D-alanine ligase|nr:UDP-N-acetylmuramoyl-tripeptide--D-alanyl-D-alanine ligase [Flavobacteriaceae bacterium]
MDINELYQCFLLCDGISTDTRNIKPNSIFFALKGDNFDANEFAQEALDKGAAFVVMDNKKLVTDSKKMLLVPNALGALQHLAKHHRQQLGLPIIALTGSNGKTTTKELIYTVLSQKYNTKATIGNLNNHIGVPLTLLSFDENTDIGIVEMGANHLNEISILCEIAQPDFGYITNFGKAHLEGFGGFEGVIKGKSELYNYLEDNHKMAFANIDDPRQDAKTMTFSRFTFGEDSEANLTIDSYSAQPNATVTVNGIEITSQLTGIYNATNIGAAIAFGTFFNVSIEDIKTAIATYTPNNNRSQWVEQANAKILLDAYNANPSSMAAAITNFTQLETTLPKVVILGDMFELGKESSKEHKQLIDNLLDSKLTEIYLIGGEFFKQQIENKTLHFYPTFESFVEALTANNVILSTKQILIKGSRGMALERILKYI